MSKIARNLVAILFLFSTAAFAQKSNSSIFTSRAEIEGAKKSMAFHIVDVGKAHVAVAEQVRPAAAKGKAGGPIEHLDVTEVYIVTAGTATMVTGGTLTDTKPFPVGPDGKFKDNGEGIGPSLRGKDANPNQVRQIVAGDVIILPPHTAHWFSEVQSPLRYLVVRIDPTKTVGLK